MTKKITKLMLNGEEYEIKEYVEPEGRQPGEHTLSYLPMSADSTTTDYGNAGWTWTQVGGTFTGNYYDATHTDYLYTSGNTYTALTDYTVMCWVYPSDNIILTANNYNDGDNGNITFFSGTAQRYNGSMCNITYTEPAGRYHIAVVGQDGILYINGVEVGTNSNNVALKPNMAGINTDRDYGLNIGESKYSKYILEDRIWTAQEIEDYYNLTKGDYGIS